jgi:hypothetical protein
VSPAEYLAFTRTNPGQLVGSSATTAGERFAGAVMLAFVMVLLIWPVASL